MGGAPSPSASISSTPKYRQVALKVSKAVVLRVGPWLTTTRVDADAFLQEPWSGSVAADCADVAYRGVYEARVVFMPMPPN